MSEQREIERLREFATKMLDSHWTRLDLHAKRMDRLEKRIERIEGLLNHKGGKA